MNMLIFPYGYDCEPIVRHTGLLGSCHKITALVSPGGWGFAGKEVAIGDSNMTLAVHESFEDVDEEFDSLLIPPFEVQNEAVENRLASKMASLIPHLSYIFCAARLSDTNRKNLKDACRNSNHPCIFTDFSEYNGLEAYGLTAPLEQYPSLKQLDVPVVAVAGLWEKTDKFEVSLSLRENFIKDGYQVSQVGSRDGCEMLGFHSFPGFMFQKDLDGICKISCFNYWLHRIIIDEQPDLLLITIPGAVQDFNEQITRGFGALHYAAFQAVVPDALVMCTLYMSEPGKSLEDISMLCRYRLGVPVDAFHMSNLLIDVNKSEEYSSIVSESIYRETVSRTIEMEFADSPIPIFNGANPDECDKIYKVLLEKLMPKDVQAVL